MSDTPTPRDRANKAHSLVLQKMPHGTAQDVAKAMGVSDSDLSNIKNKSLEPVLLLLAHLGLKVVPQSMQCMPPEAYAFLTAMHERLVRTNPTLIWENE